MLVGDFQNGGAGASQLVFKRYRLAAIGSLDTGVNIGLKLLEEREEP